LTAPALTAGPSDPPCRPAARRSQVSNHRPTPMANSLHPHDTESPRSLLPKYTVPAGTSHAQYRQALHTHSAPLGQYSVIHSFDCTAKNANSIPLLWQESNPLARLTPPKVVWLISGPSKSASRARDITPCDR